MAGGKRKHVDTIDLTGDDDDEGNHAPRKSAKPSNGGVTGPGGRHYPTPPSSSNPSFSQNGGSRFQSTRHLNSSRFGPSWIAENNVHSEQERESWLAPSQPGAPISSIPSQQDQDSWFLSTQAQEEDIRREIDLEADFDDDVYENYQLYGIFNTKIVGCRFYNGRATVGEYVKVRREPGNPYDRNAIRIDNCMGHQIGHIGRQAAAKLAPFIDSGELLIEGALTGPKTFYDCPIGMKLFGTSDPVASTPLREKMQSARLPVNELNRTEKERKQREKERAARDRAAKSMQKAGQVVVDESETSRYAYLNTSQDQVQSAVDMEEVLSGTATFNPRDVQDAVNKFVAGESTLKDMPMSEQHSALATSLLPYQRQGLQWMLEKESPALPQNDSSEPVQLWKRSLGMYTNIATNFSVTSAPDLASGGILADDMGLGKTLQVISTIIADPKKNGQPTLIVSPLSVMSNWKQQAELHVKEKHRPKVLIYHGQENRGLSPAEFREYDIVITTCESACPQCSMGANQTKIKPSLWNCSLLGRPKQRRRPPRKDCIPSSGGELCLTRVTISAIRKRR